MLVIDARLWPGGEPSDAEVLGLIAIGRVGTSAGGDYGDYLVVQLGGGGEVAKASLLRRRHVLAGWQDLLWAALDGEGAKQVALDDPLVMKVTAQVRSGVTSS